MIKNESKLLESFQDFLPTPVPTTGIVGGAKWDARGPSERDVLPLWVAEMDFATPKPVIEALRRRAEVGVFGYTVYPESTIDAFRGWMKRRHQLEVQRDWVLTSPGVVPALHAAVRSYTSPGDPVVLQSPIYHPFWDAIAKNGRTVVENPLRIVDGKYVMDFDDLDHKLKTTGAKLLILCSPHNPVGRVWTLEELKRLVAIATKYGVTIVSDEIHGDLILSGATMISMADERLGYQSRTLVCTAPSKTFNLAGLQSSFLIVPDAQLRSQIVPDLDVLHAKFPNSFAPIASESAYVNGDRWLDECLTYLSANRDYFRERLSQDFPGMPAYAPEGSYLAWINAEVVPFRGPELIQFLKKEAKIWLSPGSDFSPNHGGYVRVNLATHHSVLEQALDRLKTVHDRYFS